MVLLREKLMAYRWVSSWILVTSRNTDWLARMAISSFSARIARVRCRSSFTMPENGDLQSELLRHPFGHRYLPRAAIYQPQVGQDLKAVLFAGLGRFAVVGQPAGKHLLHRGVIIGRCLVLYREFLIQPFSGLPRRNTVIPPTMVCPPILEISNASI